MTEQARRVVVGVSGSIANLSALHAAVKMAATTDARLLAVLAWTPVGGELSYRRAPCPSLLLLWQRAAQERLRVAFEEAFGGVPPGVERMVIRGTAGPVLTAVAHDPRDLLIVGLGRALPWRHGVTRYCLRHAQCPVRTVAPPAMIHHLHHCQHEVARALAQIAR